MRLHSLTVFLGAFALTALASMTNAACSSPTDVDHGSSEAITESGHYGGHYGVPYGGANEGYFATDLADDHAF